MPSGYEPWSYRSRLESNLKRGPVAMPRDASSRRRPPNRLGGLGGAGDEALREIAELLGHDRPLDDLQPALLKAFRY